MYFIVDPYFISVFDRCSGLL